MHADYHIVRSSRGRRGLIIENAAGVHPECMGCMTLELSNVGQVHITQSPGLEICQLFIHKVESKNEAGDNSTYIGFRRPVLNEIRPDRMAAALARDRL